MAIESSVAPLPIPLLWCLPLPTGFQAPLMSHRTDVSNLHRDSSSIPRRKLLLPLCLKHLASAFLRMNRKVFSEINFYFPVFFFLFLDQFLRRFAQTIQSLVSSSSSFWANLDRKQCPLLDILLMSLY